MSTANNATFDIPEPTTTQWIGFIGMVFGMFMAILDIQIVASSIAEIQAGISATPDQITWVQTAYLIAEVIVIPLTGWLAQIFSTRYIFAACCLGFTVMSVATAFSWSIESIIVFRALQGLFGGVLIPTVFGVIYTMFPKHLQAMLSVVIGSVVTIAPTTGPILGGYLTDQFSWHYLFLINVIPGIAVTLSTWFFVDIDKPNWNLLKKVDLPGILLIAISLGCLQYVLEEGVRDSWFDSTEIVIVTLISASAGALMFYRELTTENPVIDLYAFRNFNFAFGCLFSFIIGLGLYVMTYLLPLQLSMVRGLNSYQIGLYVTVTGIFQFFSAPLAGFLSKKIDLRLMLAIGFFMFALSAFTNSGHTAEAGFWEFFLPQALRGLSIMFCFLPINSIALGTLPVHEIKNASGLYNLMRNLGGAIGLAVFNTFLINWTKESYGILRQNITATNEKAMQIYQGFSTKLADSAHLPDSELGALKMLYQIAQREATVISFNNLYLLLAFIFFLLICVIPFLRKVNVDGSTSAAGH